MPSLAWVVGDKKLTGLSVLVAVSVVTGLLFVASPADAATANASGSITGSSPTAEHPSGGSCAAGSTATHYSEVKFTTDGSTATTLNINVSPTGFRGLLVLYQGAFLPSSPGANCYVNAVEGSSSGASMSLNANMGKLLSGFTTQSWDLVVFGDTPSDLGSFTASVASSTTGVTISPPSGSSGDTTPPVLSLPSGLTAEATSGSGAAVDYSSRVSATDNVDGSATPVCAPASGSTFPLGTTTVSCTATDKAGNTATGSFTVTVADTTAPTLHLPGGIQVEQTSSAGAPVDYSGQVSASDAVDGSVTPVCTPASGTVFAAGATTVKCTATDSAGNQASGSFQVAVADTTAPVVSVPPNKTTVATGPAGAAVAYGTVSATDNIDGPLPVTCTSPSSQVVHTGDTFPLGATQVTCAATDAAGNTGTASFTVTVVDTTAPTVTVPHDQTVQASGPNGAAVTFPAPTATDLVDGSVPVTCTSISHQTVKSGDTFPLGATQVTCAATDAAGNTGTASFTITVADTVAPTVQVPGAISVPAAGPAGAPVTYTATATDRVDDADPVTCAPASGTIFPIGTTTVYCTSRDHAGNTATGSFQVRVQPIVDPVITAHLSSRQHHPRAGWYRRPVTVSFTCHAGSAPLTGPCPGPITLTGNGRHQLRRTITASDTGHANARVSVNIDQTRPRLQVTGVRRGHVYRGTGPTQLRCLARDHLSGTTHCRIRRHRHGNRVTFIATARDRAGNRTWHRGHYRVLSVYVVGARRRHGRFVVTTGHTYTLVAAVHAAHQPLFLQAAPAGQRPRPAAPPLRRNRYGVWYSRFTITTAMHHYRHWVIGVRAHHRVWRVPITVIR